MGRPSASTLAVPWLTWVGLLLAGCGTAEKAEPESPATSPRATSAAPTRSLDLSGASFGVDRAEWPHTLESARVLVKKLPTELDGEPGTVDADPGEEPSLGAEYGELAMLTVSAEEVTTDTEDGKPEVMNANNQLAANFLLGAACADGTYQGTAPMEESGAGPAVVEKPLANDVWFSCTVGAVEGEGPTGQQVVGWTSGKTAWLVIARDPNGARSLIGALQA